MNKLRLFVKPGTDPVSKELFQVWIPSKGRNINPEGERVAVDAYISRRILSGELVTVDKPEEAAEATTEETPAKTTGQKKDNKTTKPTGGN